MKQLIPARALVLFLAFVVAGCPKPTTPTTPMPGGLDLAGLLPEHRALLRVTLEISDGALDETELTLSDDLQTLSGVFGVQNVTAPVDRELSLRVYGRYSAERDEVLLGQLRKPITLLPETDVEIIFSSTDVFDSCGGEPGACAVLFDANRNGASNIEDLLERERSDGRGIDPAQQPSFLVTTSEQLQFPSGVRLGTFARQLVVLENFGDHDVVLTSVRVIGGQGFSISILDPSGQSVAPPSRELDHEAFAAIAPGQEAFIAVSFSPVNAYVTTGALFVRAQDTLTLVERTLRVKLIANPEGELRPADPTYAPPAVSSLGTIGGDVNIVSFPNAQLQSGQALLAEDMFAGGLRRSNASIPLVDGEFTTVFPVDAAMTVRVRPGERFATALDGLTSDIDIAVVDVVDGGVVGLACAGCLSDGRGTSPEAVEFKNTSGQEQTVAILLGRIDPIADDVDPVTPGALTATFAETAATQEAVSFRCATTLTTGPEFSADAPVSPTTGPLEGGIPVRLRGTGFHRGARVTVGGAEAIDVLIETADTGDNTVTFTLPRAFGTDNPAAIVVENPDVGGGDGQAATLLEAFTYQPPAPVIDDLFPDLASSTGGNTPTTVRGRFFSQRHGPPLVSFGTVVVPATFVSAAELSVVAPPHVDVNAAATVSVKVRNRVAPDQGGEVFVGSPSNGYAFRYLRPDGDPPVITRLQDGDDVGSVDGGTAVTIEGEHFRPGVRVFFGSREALCDEPTGETTVLRCVAPAVDEPRTVDIIVVNDDAQTSTLSQAFRYEIPAPSLVSIFPERGVITGGTLLVIEGGGFRPGARVTFTQNDVETNAAAATRTSGTTLLVTTPPGVDGSSTLTVRNVDGQSVSSTFTYFSPAQGAPSPVIASLSPAVGDAGGGFPVFIRGTGFANAEVLFGGVSVQVMTSIDRDPPELDQLEVIAPVSPTGVAAAVTIQVVNDDGQATTVGFNYTFTASAPPRIDRVTPSSFFTEGPITFTLSGARFDSGAVVVVGGAQAQIEQITGASIKATLQQDLLPGLVQVTVENPNGASASIPVPVVAPVVPAISALSATHAHADVAGDTVTLLGTGLDQGPVSVVVEGEGLPGIPARVVIQTASYLLVELPAVSAGERTLVVTMNPPGQPQRVMRAPPLRFHAPSVIFSEVEVSKEGDEANVFFIGDAFNPTYLHGVSFVGGDTGIPCDIVTASEGALRCRAVGGFERGVLYEVELKWVGTFDGSVQQAVVKTARELGAERGRLVLPLEVQGGCSDEEFVRTQTDFDQVEHPAVCLRVPGFDPNAVTNETALVVEIGAGCGFREREGPESCVRGVVDLDASAEDQMWIGEFSGGLESYESGDHAPAIVSFADSMVFAEGFAFSRPRTINFSNNGSVGWEQLADRAFQGRFANPLDGDSDAVVAVRARFTATDDNSPGAQIPLELTERETAPGEFVIENGRDLAPGSWQFCFRDQIPRYCGQTYAISSLFIVSPLTEREPNDDGAHATGFSLFSSMQGSIEGQGTDFFFFRTDAVVENLTFMVEGGCHDSTRFELRRRLDNHVLVENACTNTSPVSVQEDEFLVVVANTSGQSREYAFRLEKPFCGNGTVDLGEQCDEGSSFDPTPKDCSANCLEPDEDRDAQGGKALGQIPTPAFGRTLTPGDVDRFTFVVEGDADQNVRVDVFNRVGNACALVRATVAGQNLPRAANGCVGATRRLSRGTYELVLEGDSNVLKYGVVVEPVADATCVGGTPNREVQQGETCDDGDAEGGDGCSPNCQQEPGFQCTGSPSTCVVDCGNGRDPGNDCEEDSLENPVRRPGVPMVRSLTLADTKDFFAFNVFPGTTPIVSIFELDEPCTGQGFTIFAFNQFGQQGSINAPTNCFKIPFLGLEPGEYVMQVERATPSATTYQFSVEACGDGRIGPGESCDDGDNVDGDGCSAGCEPEVGYLCTRSPSVCRAVTCVDSSLDAPPPAPFETAQGFFTTSGYRPDARTKPLITQNLRFPTSVEVDVEWNENELAFVGIRSDGSPVSPFDEPANSLYLRLHIGLGDNKVDLNLGGSQTLQTQTMPLPELGVYRIQIVDDGGEVSATISRNAAQAPPVRLFAFTQERPGGAGNNRVILSGETVHFRNAKVCQGAQ